MKDLTIQVDGGSVEFRGGEELVWISVDEDSNRTIAPLEEKDLIKIRNWINKRLGE